MKTDGTIACKITVLINLDSHGILKNRVVTSRISKQRLLLQMLEEEEDGILFQQPKNLLRYLYIVWFGLGFYELRKYYKVRNYSSINLGIYS